MTPSSPMNDEPNRGIGYPILLGDSDHVGNSLVDTSYSQYVRFAEFCSRVALAARTSSFFIAIRSVFCTRSKPEMFWVYAESIVAFVQDAFFSRPFPMPKKESDPVRKLNRGSPVCCYSKMPITIVWPAAVPNPTWPKFTAVHWDWSVLVNLAPKTFRVICGHGEKSCRPAKVSSAQMEPQSPNGSGSKSSFVFSAMTKPGFNMTNIQLLSI
jgi:hypothetical protein